MFPEEATSIEFQKIGLQVVQERPLIEKKKSSAFEKIIFKV